MNNRQLTKEQIRARAYAIFCQRGSQHGHAIDDWLQAEYELMQLPIHKIAKLEPPRSKPAESRELALVSLVQTALLVGGSSLSQFRR